VPARAGDGGEERIGHMAAQHGVRPATRRPTLGDEGGKVLRRS
jgi:hypothetical protein